MTSKATAAVAAIAATLTLAAPASATLLPTGPLAGGGGFVIQSCGESGSSQGWTATNNAPARLETFIDCPPSLGRFPEYPNGRYYTGLHAGGKRGRDSVTLDDAQAGDQAELTFTANTGTQITRVRMWREAFKNDDNDWWPYIKAGATTLDSCEIVWPQTFCVVGAAGGWVPNGENDMDPGYFSFYDSALPANLPSLSTPTVTVGILCRPQGDSICSNGYLAPDAEAEIYSAFLTLADTSTPTLGPTSPDWNATTPITSSPAFLVSGTDNSGIRSARLYLDNTLVAEQQATCSYDRPRPCSDLLGSGPLGFEPATFSDGDHQLQLAVVDAAGNETRTAPVTRQVDGTPPPAPQITTTSLGVNSTRVSWQPAADSGPAAATSSAWRLCAPDGSCGQPTSGPATSSSNHSVGAAGWTVRVRLTDTAGRSGPEASVTLPYTAPANTSTTTTGSGTTNTTPTTTTPVTKTPTALSISRPAVSGRTVSITGTVGVAKTALTVTLTTKDKKRITRRMTATGGRYKIKIRGVPRGRWKITVRYPGSSTRLPSAAARTITVRAVRAKTR